MWKNIIFKNDSEISIFPSVSLDSKTKLGKLVLMFKRTTEKVLGILHGFRNSN